MKIIVAPHPGLIAYWAVYITHDGTIDDRRSYVHWGDKQDCFDWIDRLKRAEVVTTEVEP